MICVEGDKHFRQAEELREALIDESVLLNSALDAAMKAVAQMDFNAFSAALQTVIKEETACTNLKNQADIEYGKAADAYRECANRAFERGDFKQAVELFRMARTCGAADLEAAEAAAEDQYKTKEREQDDQIQPASRPVLGAEADGLVFSLPPFSDIDVEDEQHKAAEDEQAADDAALTGNADPLHPVEVAKKLISAARHHWNAGYELRLDPCARADEYAAAADDYARAAMLMLSIGNPQAASWNQYQAASLAKYAAELYEHCAQRADEGAKQRDAMRYWSKADTNWERAWLFWDRMRRYWTLKRMQARDKNDPRQKDYKREAEDAADRANRAERHSKHAQERIDTDAHALKLR